jgi:hypothetical protein
MFERAEGSKPSSPDWVACTQNPINSINSYT